MKPTFADKAFNFYATLSFPFKLPAGIVAMNPYQRPDIQNYLRTFLDKFHADHKQRVFVFGINPGRLGAGVTGVTFTDPVALSDYCGIPNSLPRVRERSSEFIYAFIEKYGGAKKFYRHFFLTAISPLGFTYNGINYNYYDSPTLLKITKPFIVQTLKAQLDMGADRENVILIGSGKNQKFFNELNSEYDFFKHVYTIEHPRFIMQYKRKSLPQYLEKYRELFAKALTQQRECVE